MRVGLLHPGAMGIAVAQTMVNSGVKVTWVSHGRSEATRARAEQAALFETPSLEECCTQVDALVSVCPPHAAETVAEAVIAAGFGGLYLDANAISPQKTGRIGQKMTQAGIDYVDGGIIGGPPTQPGTTWLHLCGPSAGDVAALFSAGPLETELLGDEIGRASAIKMCFAARTKGTTALLTAILGAAVEMDILGPLEAQWDRYNPGFAEQTRERVSRTAHQKAWRFVGEMEEMADTFGAAGLPAGFFEAAADVYQRVAHFQDSEDQPTLKQIVAALARPEN